MKVKETVINAPDFLEVGIKVETYIEPKEEIWYVYYRVITWMGFDSSLKVEFEKTYLEGKIEGLQQIIKIELPNEEAAIEIAEKFHEIAVLTAEGIQDAFKAKTFLALIGE